MGKRAVGKPVIAVLVSLLGVGLGLAGCGGDSDEASGDDGAVAKAAFVKQANAICAENREKAKGELKSAYGTAQARGASTERDAINLEATVLTPILIDGVEAQTAEIRDIGLPSEGEDQITAMLDAFDAWRSKAEGSPLKVVLANNVYNEGRELAGEYGLAECAKSPFET